MKYKLSGELQENAHVLVSISIGQDKQTGQYLDETISLVGNDDAVKKITILKADILQRHRLMVSEGLNEPEARKLASEKSTIWDNENKKILDKLKTKYDLEILDWDMYLKDNGFEEALTKVRTKYDNESKFKREVDRLTCIFLEKTPKNSFQKNKHKFTLKTDFEEFCVEKIKNYIFEECAVFILLIRDERKFDYELYRSERNMPLRAIYNDQSLVGRMKPLSLIKDKTHQDINNPGCVKLNKKAKITEEDGGFSLKLTHRKGNIKFSAKIEANDESDLTATKILNFSILFLNNIKEFDSTKGDNEHKSEQKQEASIKENQDRQYRVS